MPPMRRPQRDAAVPNAGRMQPDVRIKEMGSHQSYI